MATPKYGTVERKIDMMKYICLHRNTTMLQLSEMFGVSIRTVMRDLADVGDFIPITTHQGRYEGGVSVDKNYSWDKAYMSGSDIALLKKVRRAGEHGERLELDEGELLRLDKIINTYEKPKN